MKKLNVGLIGYGFKGRTHSNAFRKVNNFFDLQYQPVLKAVCARNAENAKSFADKWGYQSVETDWRKLVDRKDIPSAGAGETPIVGLAPAAANAIFNASGTRLRSLPLAPKGLSI